MTPADCGELARLLQAVLAGGGVHDEEDFVRRAGDELCGGAAHFVELVHEAGFGVEAAGGVDDELGDVAGFGGAECVVEDGRGVAALAGLDHFDAAAAGPDFKLLDGGGAEGVGGAEEDGLVLGAVPGGELAAGGGLAGAVDADQEGDLWAEQEAWRRGACGASKDLADLVLEQARAVLRRRRWPACGRVRGGRQEFRWWSARRCRS